MHNNRLKVPPFCGKYMWHSANSFTIYLWHIVKFIQSKAIHLYILCQRWWLPLLLIRLGVLIKRFILYILKLQCNKLVIIKYRRNYLLLQWNYLFRAILRTSVDQIKAYFLNLMVMTINKKMHKKYSYNVYALILL